MYLILFNDNNQATCIVPYKDITNLDNNVWEPGVYGWNEL